MDLQRLAWIDLALLAAAFPVAHLVAFAITARLRVPLSRLQDAMPGLPAAAGSDLQGAPGRRWERRMAVLERKVLRWMRRNPGTVEAPAVAAALAESLEGVQAVLEDLAGRVDARIRVTRGGRILYDFDLPALGKLRGGSLLAAVGRPFVLLAAVVTNLGAAWPVMLIGGMAAGTLVAALEVAGGGDEAEVKAALVAALGLAAMGLVLAAVAIVGRGLRALLSPLTAGPRAIARHPAAVSADGEAASSGAEAGLDRLGKRWMGSIGNDRRFPALALVVAVAVALLWSVVAVVLWFVGLVRAIWFRSPPHPDIAPGTWARRGSRRASGLSRFIPSNDVTIRIARALRRNLVTRPSDRDLPGRITARAGRGKGLIGAPDLALREGFPLRRAIDAGSRMAGQLRGDIDVSAAGDLFFRLSGPTSESPGPVPTEVAEIEESGTVERVGPGAPVNLPGLSHDDLRAVFRVAAGTFLLAALPALSLVLARLPFAETRAVLAGASAEAGRAGLWVPASLALLHAMNLGVLTLAATLAYAVRASARTGLYRDLRRAAAWSILAAMDGGPRTLDATALAGRLHRSFLPAWPGLPEPRVQTLVEDLCLQIRLELDLDATAAAPGHALYDLDALRERRAAVMLVRSLTSRPAPGDDDEVVFDTAAPAG